VVAHNLAGHVAQAHGAVRHRAWGQAAEVHAARCEQQLARALAVGADQASRAGLGQPQGVYLFLRGGGEGQGRCMRAGASEKVHECVVEVHQCIAHAVKHVKHVDLRLGHAWMASGCAWYAAWVMSAASMLLPLDA
jgi:hypothetical protein